MKIIKVINNNTVCAIDDKGDFKGKEQIVSGKGIGFGKKYGDEIDPSQIQKTYLITDSELQKKMISLLRDIPEEYMRFTESMVEHIRKECPGQLSESLLVTLSDHISFAIERQKKGMEFTNPLMDSIRECYPQELKLGEYCVRQMKQQLGIEMLPDEAGFIAMHIINARLDIKMNDVYDITKMINGCVEVAQYYYDRSFDRSSPLYERFVSHLKYLAQRLVKDQELPETLSSDEAFSQMLIKT
ncbi:MAG: PRD domain-containing protein, partial [Oscillospiraceae bacterium]